MLRFKQFITNYLIEAKIDDYKSQETEISTDHDPHGIHKTSSDIIDHFHSHNPTGDVNHTRWMVNQYKQGNIKQEDAPAMKDLLTSFNSNRDKLKKKRLEQYKTHGELNTALQSVAPSKTQLQSQRELDTIQKGSTPIHNSPESSWYHVHDKHASRVLGKGMPWCTSRMDEQNMFDHYNSMSNGRFYIGHMHNEQFPFRKIGVGVGTGEFQDENNDRIEGDRLKEFIARNPHLKDIKELQGTNVQITKNPHEHFDDLIENDQYGLEDYMSEKPILFGKEHHKRLKQFYDEENRAMKQDESVKSSKFTSPVTLLAQHTTNPDLLHELSNHSHPSVRNAVSNNDHTSIETLLKLSKDPVAFVRGGINITKIPKEHRDDILKNETHPDVLQGHTLNIRKDKTDNLDDYSDTLFNNKKTTDEILYHILHKYPSEKFLEHPGIGSRSLYEIARNSKSDDIETHRKIASHPESTDNILGILSRKSKDPEVHERILKHKNAKDALEDLVRSSNDPKILEKIASHPESGGFTLSALFGKTKDPKILEKILKHRNTDGYVLANIVQQTNDPKIHNEILKHDKVNSATLNSLIKQTNDPELHKRILNHEKSDGYTVFSPLASIYGVDRDKIQDKPHIESKIDEIIKHRKNNPYQLESKRGMYETIKNILGK